MPRTGRPTAPLVLTDEERSTLIRWSRRAKSAQVLAMRAKIILACAEGGSNTDVAAALGVHLSAVGKWRRRFDTCDGATPTPASPTSSPPNAGNEPASAANVNNAGDGPEPRPPDSFLSHLAELFGPIGATQQIDDLAGKAAPA